MTIHASLGPLGPAVHEALARLRTEHFAERLWNRDGTLWSSDPTVARECERWLGWLDVPDLMATLLGEFDAARREMGRRYDRVVLFGMGGSSLCPDVLRHTFGRVEGSPELTVLDTTCPLVIEKLAAELDLARTLFLVASKSGGTLETLSHYRYFFERVREAGVESGSRNFIAITDEGSGLHEESQAKDFGHAFLNPADIGGRYSALSYFGMVPAALMGLDVAVLLQRARAMARECRGEDPEHNPGLDLGAVLGAAATHGRDKVTIACSPGIATLGMWLEQLLAESTGKEGKGIIPVEGEPLLSPSAYGDDRLFVDVRVAGDTANEAALAALRDAGQPVVTIEVADSLDLAGEFMRWEVATAVAGALLGINPFDQPNVQESKDNTKAVLASWTDAGGGAREPEGTGGGDVMAQLQPGDYLAVLAYTEPGDAVEAALDRLRHRVMEKHHVATTTGYGPRYLHSTGQLHKGGPNSGVFLILSDARGSELPIPEEPFGFKTLFAAQWVGDLKSLRDHGRRVSRVPLHDDPVATIDELSG